ncbi:HAD-IIB family hydrolase [Salinirubellus salinus]|uniref:Phosphoglycolate phosphatase n=1 Tax=Salinirubellus salinus TaxID=1364945 RepID=A0A9E7R4C4_9EURY|nr:HAD-IIB family hydrolase [Salinirubellus salinus]UWM55625.1 HAD-IIB family hydrolase [Salinirubellus salinus]
MTDLPPLAVDIDGTLTDAERRLDPRVFPVLREWAAEAPVVVATGKALPYPVGLCEFLAIPINVVAENGGAVYVASADELRFTGDRAAAERVAEDYAEAGHSLGWGTVDFVNRWRETELAVALEQPESPLREAADRHGMRVIDTGFAYHVTSPEVNKARGLEAAADALDRSPAEFVAVGDSENDAELFEVVGESYAVANADETALAAAHHVTDAGYGDGFLEATDRVRAEFAAGGDSA